MTNAEREAIARQARRRQAVTVLRVGETVCGYAAAQLADGLSPEAARQAARDAAAELEVIAGTLRRLTRPRPDLDAAGRRALAVELARRGLSHRQIAARVGRSERRVWDYLRGR